MQSIFRQLAIVFGFVFACLIWFTGAYVANLDSKPKPVAAKKACCCKVDDEEGK